MDMDMKHGLPGRGSRVHADVAAGDARVILGQPVPEDPQQAVRVIALRLGHGEPVRPMALGDDQMVAG